MFCEGRFTELGIHAQDRFFFAAGLLLRADSHASFTFSTHHTPAVTESLALARDGPTIRFIASNRQENFLEFLKWRLAGARAPMGARAAEVLAASPSVALRLLSLRMGGSMLPSEPLCVLLPRRLDCSGDEP